MFSINAETRSSHADFSEIPRLIAFFSKKDYQSDREGLNPQINQDTCNRIPCARARNRVQCETLEKRTVSRKLPPGWETLGYTFMSHSIHEMWILALQTLEVNGSRMV